MRILLASTSPYRRKLLERLSLNFLCVAPDVDESPQENERPESLAARLSLAKSAEVAERYPEDLVIGSDQVAELHGLTLGKPGGRDTAVAQLRACSGQSVQFLTGVALSCKATGFRQVHVESVQVRFRQLADAEISRYVALEKPFDCAGSFKIEGLGITLFERVVSEDPTSLEGLPLIALSRMLRTAGMKLP
tara:strand:- start:13478 stop:14053 length:576 start_codon:yes stop_codon:yes gene_type:complete